MLIVGIDDSREHVCVGDMADVILSIKRPLRLHVMFICNELDPSGVTSALSPSHAGLIVARGKSSVPSEAREKVPRE